MLGDQIEIIIVDVKGDQVKIGIKAPREMTILRSEIYTEIKDENVLATKTATPDDLGKTLGSLFGGKDNKDKKSPVSTKPVVKIKKPRK
jgi:carbon storage regulator